MNLYDQRLPERFWKHVKPVAEHWLWIGPVWSNGYGRFKLEGIDHRVHRLVYTLVHGETDMIVRHICDIRICCAPTCLIEGTQLDNITDREVRQRTAQGENIGPAKLTADDVREIRRLHKEGPMTQTQIAERFGIGQSQVSHIVLRRVWRHVVDN